MRKSRTLLSALTLALVTLHSAVKAQDNTPVAEVKAINSVSMLEADCFATSWHWQSWQKGNHKLSKRTNQPRPLSQLAYRGEIPKGQIVLKVYPQKISNCVSTRTEAIQSISPEEEIALIVANTTAIEHTFDVWDSRLYLVQEALNKEGKWRPIEYIFTSWCGNSYYKATLQSNEFWSFKPRRYTGTYKTKLRFRLMEGLHKLLPENKAPLINHLSNEFEGSINPEQFDTSTVRFPYRIIPELD